MCLRTKAAGGYTLLELTIVLTVLMLVGISYLSAEQARSSQEKYQITAERLDAIQTALVRYRRVNAALPCPARGAYTIASDHYGKAAANAGSCTGGTPAADYNTTNLAAGTVPTKALGLDDEYMYDGWNRRFTYAVDTRATATCTAPCITCAFVNYNIADATVGFTVNDSAGTARTSNAWYVLVSHGPNGHGAFLRSGTRYNSSSSNASEQLNCHCNSSAASTGLTAVFVDKALTESSADNFDRYDDIVRYALRSQLRSDYDESGTTESCP